MKATEHYSSVVQAADVQQFPVVRKPISDNPGLNFNGCFFFFCSKAFYQIILTILFGAPYHPIVGKKNYTTFTFIAFISGF